MTNAILAQEHTQRWNAFWATVNLGQLVARVHLDVAHVMSGDELVAEFTPDNAPEFITEVLGELQA